MTRGLPFPFGKSGLAQAEQSFHIKEFSRVTTRQGCVSAVVAGQARLCVPVGSPSGFLPGEGAHWPNSRLSLPVAHFPSQLVRLEGETGHEQ